MFNDLRGEAIVCFVDIGRNVGHHCSFHNALQILATHLGESWTHHLRLGLVIFVQKNNNDLCTGGPLLKKNVILQGSLMYSTLRGIS